MNEQNQASDKIDLHNRQQLSALMDGALAPDEARFLLRRLQHDGELSGCWERWQLAGEVMRGRATAVLPQGFAGRVGDAIARDATAAPKSPARPRMGAARWTGGIALAASVAVVALLALGEAPDAPGQPVSSMAVVASAPAAEEPPAASTSSPIPVPGQQRSSSRAAPTVAAADPPRRNPQRVRSTSRPRIEARPSSPAAGTAPDEAAIVSAAEPAQTSRPFDAGPLPSARPWPRAVLPQLGGSGALNAGADASTSPSFYPFEPRMPEETVEPDTGPAQPR